MPEYTHLPVKVSVLTPLHIGNGVDLLNEYDYDDFGKQIIPAAINKYRIFSYPFNGYWEDIGTIRAFYEANLALAGREGAEAQRCFEEARRLERWNAVLRARELQVLLWNGHPQQARMAEDWRQVA